MTEEYGSRKWHYFLWKKEELKWLPKNAFSTGIIIIFKL